MIKFLVDATGKYLGSFDGADPPDGAVEVETAPRHAKDTWDSKTQAWTRYHEIVPQSVDAKLEKAMTEIAALKDRAVVLETKAVVPIGPSGDVDVVASDVL